MGTGPTPSSAPAPRPSNLVPAVVTLVAVLLALIAGFLVWFSISVAGWSGTSPLLPDAYNAMYVYATKGSTSLNTYSPLGAMLVKESTANPIVLFAFAVVLFFWPAMVVSGVYSVLARAYGPYPFIWGLVAFVFAYITVYYAGDSLGIGAYLALVAAILFLVGTATVRRPKAAPAEAAPAPPAPAAAPPEPSSSAPSEPPANPES